MAETKKQPTKIAFILSQGGLTGIWRGFLLSEIYCLLVALFFVSLSLIENVGGSGAESALGVLLGAMLYGQMIGVIPSVVIGFVAGLLIASGVIALQERTAGAKLAAAIAVLLSIFVDLLTGTGELGINYGYFIFLGLPALIFALDAVRTTRKKLPAVEENFTSGRLSASIVNGFFWGALTLKAVVLIYIFFITQ